MKWLRSQGHPIVGVEISPIAVRDFFLEAQIDAASSTVRAFERSSGGGYDLFCGDFFDLTPPDLSNVRAVYDRAALIALPPEMRIRYAEHIQSILPHEVEILLMSGTIKYGNETFRPGHYLHIPPGVAMPEMKVSRAATVLMMYNFAEPSFIESDENHRLAMPGQLTSVNAYDDIQWQPGDGSIHPAVAPGCLLKVLKYDPLTQALSFLYCMTQQNLLFVANILKRLVRCIKR